MSAGPFLDQSRARGLLEQALSSGEIPPALLFTGPPGVGKEEAALELARALNCVGDGGGPQSDLFGQVDPEAAPVAEAKPGAGFAVSATVCHVTRFTKRVKKVFPLPVGDYDWRDLRFVIEPDRPVRSIYLTVSLEGVHGRAMLDDVVVAEVAGALLAFTLSLDDFVITFFTSGPGSTTFPIKIYSMVRFSVTPEVNAASTVLIVVTLALTITALAIQSRASKG